MPRVARRKDAATEDAQLRSPKSIPLNDDQYEKAARFQSRQALQELQLNQIRAAASPGHRRAYHASEKDGQTSTEQRTSCDDDKENRAAGVASTTLGAIKRVPILANFEEWMKMATDNKINATNSWNFALIDYFHDMSLLKEGDSVNFQKASCTLDGCVKIYTSRVDSVATETGKLLSGLADSGNKNQESNADDEDDEDDQGEEDGKRKTKRKVRSSEATLATSFTQLHLKKFELEFAVDPLFKKASADFDEGGAKGLLLNHLCIDNSGRIIFDSSDDADDSPCNPDETKENSQAISSTSNLPEKEEDDAEVNLGDLQAAYFPEISVLDNQDICPSLKTLDIGETMDLTSLQLLQEHKTKGAEQEPYGANTDVVDAGLLGLGGEDDTDLGFEPGFGAGGETWAQEAGLNPLLGAGMQVLDSRGGDGDDPEEDKGLFGVKMQFGPRESLHPDILGYFDNSTKANWAGPEHWRIRRMKREAGPRDIGSREAPRRKEKEPFEIDFRSSLSSKVAEQIYTSASSSSAISLPRSQWRFRTRHLLPDDKHFNSNHLLRLFLKPKARLGRRGGRKHIKGMLSGNYEPRHVDNDFWAKSQAEAIKKTEYDADFFREDDANFPVMLDEDMDEFADAREVFSPPFGQEEEATSLSVIGTDINGDLESAYGSSLVTRSRRTRPEYVSYAKVAKKVDVRLLKEKMWKGIGFDDYLTVKNAEKSDAEDQELNFTSVVNRLQSVYTPEAMAEISTSYCFISLLHLANEKGLVLNNDHSLEELSIRRDMTAEVSATA